MSNPSATQDKQKAGQRNKRGRYIEGNVGGPGNPFARKVAHLRTALNHAISPTMVGQVVDTIFKLALEGSVPAARLFLQYAVGKPVEVESPDRIEIDEWKLRQDSVVSDKDFQEQVRAVPLAYANLSVNLADIVHYEKLDEELAIAFPGSQAKKTAEQSVPAPTTPATTEQTDDSASVAPEQTVSGAEQTVSAAPVAPEQTVSSAPVPESLRANGSHGAATPVRASTHVTTAAKPTPDADRVA